MDQKLVIYNSLSRKKEVFQPIHPPHVGLYVCGPTVYGEPHLGHARGTIVFDVLYRYLMHIGYKVRYVKNITDVGHLEDEVEGTGEDRISKRAKLEKLEPMEVVQKYKNLFSDIFHLFNVKSPSIEPQASGHIIEQIEMIKDILEAGFAYESNGSIYFDIEKYNKDHNYGQLSGRKIEDMLNNTRTLDGQGEKHNPLDFALWKNASPEHLMHWPSPWGDGFPGWHLECSAMGTKYLGETFDIHGGGMDLLFPHHECEIAQSVAAKGKSHVKYWMHNNMITIDGQKMGKSLNNFITLREFFSGEHERLNRAFSPMTIRFFMLQAHYRSTLDFSNDALEASEKGLKKLFDAIESVEKLPEHRPCFYDFKNLKLECYKALNDDLNTPILISHLFDVVRYINWLKDRRNSISKEEKKEFKEFFNLFVFEILGLQKEGSGDNQLVGKLIDFILDVRQESKQKKDYATSDKIRDSLTAMGIIIKDTKDGAEWQI